MFTKKTQPAASFLAATRLAKSRLPVSAEKEEPAINFPAETMSAGPCILAGAYGCGRESKSLITSLQSTF